MTDKAELAATIKIYKIVGIIFAILIIFGITYSIMTREKAPEPKPTPEIKPEPIPEVTPVPENVTTPEPIITPIPVNVTNQTNITQNITISATPEPTPTPAPQTFNYTWEGISVQFPDTLKRVNSGSTTHHYITITEADGTPVTNGEQFELKFIVDQQYGVDSELVPSFEAGKWLITLRLTNPGNILIKAQISCEEQKGHCQRLYPAGSTERTTTTEVV